jgi:phosphate transport system substrate-binding protein
MRLLALCLSLVCAALAIGIPFYSPAAEPVRLMGAGATFPYPFYAQAFSRYSAANGVEIHYDAVGSGKGIERLLKREVDFAGTDAFMTEKEAREAGAPVVHVPTCIGAVVVVYNLPGNPKLRLGPDTLSDIFLGNITRWNDPRLRETNPGVRLPDLPIEVIHRSDGSGTTFIFSDYLSKVSPQWNRIMGKGKSLQWRVGRGAQGNPGVAGAVSLTPGAVGYVELIYALGHDMTFAAIRNRAGEFVEPDTASVSLAARIPIPENTEASLTDTEAPGGYPISGLTWIALYREQQYQGRKKEQALALAKLLWWLTHEGQALAEPLHYAPLPQEVVLRAERLLSSLTFAGAPLLP